MKEPVNMFAKIKVAKKELPFYTSLKKYKKLAKEMYNYPVIKEEKDRRFNYFHNTMLKDPEIKFLKKEDDSITITYKNGQIFKCKGFVVTGKD